MADAHFELTLSPLIDTVFKNNIGERSANRNRRKGTLRDVSLKDGEIHLELELGGIVESPWSITIEVEIGDDTFETVPKTVKGKIPTRGTSKTDRMLKLKKKEGLAAS